MALYRKDKSNNAQIVPRIGSCVKRSKLATILYEKTRATMRKYFPTYEHVLYNLD